MYLRRKDPQPTSTTLQITGQLTIHHQSHELPHFLHSQNELSRILSQKHHLPVPLDKKQVYQKTQVGQKELNQAYSYHQHQNKRQELIEKKEQNKSQQKKQKLSKKYKQSSQNMNRRERLFNKQKGRETERRQEEEKETETARFSFVKSLKQLGEQLQKIEKALEYNIRGLNFQTLYQMRKVQKDLELKSQYLFYQLDEQLQQIREANQEWKEEMMSERKILLKEREEWKQEKEQLVKEFQAAMEKMVEEEQRQAQLSKWGQSFSVVQIWQKEMRKLKANLMGEVEKIGEGLSLAVQNVYKTSEGLQRQLEMVNTKVHEFQEKPSSISVVNPNFSEIDKTPYAWNFVAQKAIKLNNEIKGEYDSECQMALLDVVIGKENFLFEVFIKRLETYSIYIGVTDRVTQKFKQMPSYANSISYQGCIGEYGEGNIGKQEQRSVNGDDFSQVL